MQSIIYIDDKKFVPIEGAYSFMEISGDEVVALCSSGQIECKEVGGKWYLNEVSLNGFLENRNLAKGEVKSGDSPLESASLMPNDKLKAQASQDSVTTDEIFSEVETKNNNIVRDVDSDVSVPVVITYGGKY
jgi:hypothetical protein